MVHVTQDREEAAAFAHRIVMVSEGRIERIVAPEILSVRSANKIG